MDLNHRVQAGLFASRKQLPVLLQETLGGAECRSVRTSVYTAQYHVLCPRWESAVSLSLEPSEVCTGAAEPSTVFPNQGPAKYRYEVRQKSWDK